MKSIVIDSATGIQKVLDSRIANVLVYLNRASWPTQDKTEITHFDFEQGCEQSQGHSSNNSPAICVVRGRVIASSRDHSKSFDR